MKTFDLPLTEMEARELWILLAQEINDTVSNRKARIPRHPDQAQPRTRSNRAMT